ncbi:pyridoxal 5'-phosphate synthase glutaminase subunit PdxT [Microlunatus sp. GCM10028923]|uniref:pyridoxal 5'-phosphate synthase glutaminase subunit PdxT n=1 Tax=Microlunatus sp. GCM10028923 TaxID=3273400 RepID=UPI00361E9001
MIGVLALQGDVAEHSRLIRQAGGEVCPVRRPRELAGLAGLIIPGGESTTIGKLLVAFDLYDELRGAIKEGLPVLGTCAGLIMLADTIVGGTEDQRTLGGIDMVARRNAFGRQVDSFEADLAVRGLDDPFRAVFIRAPWVERVGSGVEVLAEYEGHPVAVRQGSLWATSFHPELAGDPRIHAAFLSATAVQ